MIRAGATRRSPFCHTFTGAGGGAPTVPEFSVEFNGSNQYLSMSSANWGSYDRAKFAIAGSLNPDDTGAGSIIHKAVDGSNFEFLFDISGGDIYFAVRTVSEEARFYYTTGEIFPAVTWSSFLIHVDTANATSADRIKIWVDGTPLTATTYTAPTAPASANVADVEVGRRGGTYLDGLLYSLAFFSGTLPDPTDIFDGTEGNVLPFTGLTGLHSYLSVAGGSVVADAVLSTDWTNNNTVTASSAIP